MRKGPRTIGRPTYAVHPCLLVYARLVGGVRELVIETSSCEPPLIVRDPGIIAALSQLPPRFSRREALRWWGKEFSADESEAMWDVCLRERLVLELGADSTELATYERWAGYGWEDAYTYHAATRSYPFVELNSPAAAAADLERMREYSREAPPPAIYQHVAAATSIPLARVDMADTVDAALASLTPERRRGVDGIGYLFDLCFGARGTIEFPEQGSFLLKSTPSGGARHTTEVFVLGLRGFPLGTGSFHYDVEGHAFERFDTREHSEAARQATFDLFDALREPPIALVVFSALFERAMWRYRDPRSWRAVLADVGHAVALFGALSNALGYLHRIARRFRALSIARLLRLEPLRQAPLLVATLG